MLRGEPWVAEAPNNLLLLAFSDGCIARYRILRDRLEYRANGMSPWVSLTAEQTLQHLSIKTVVGEWLIRHSQAQATRPVRAS
jgi:hypothetical protein